MNIKNEFRYCTIQLFYLILHRENKTRNINHLNKIIMSKQEILDNILMLSRSQGSYGRLYEQLTAGTEESEEALNMLESQNFGDVVDMVLFIEG